MTEVSYLDITLIRCPNCGKLYSDASWYVVDMESDIECGECGFTFNTFENIVKRFLLKIELDETGRLGVEVDRVFD